MTRIKLERKNINKVKANNVTELAFGVYFYLLKNLSPDIWLGPCNTIKSEAANKSCPRDWTILPPKKTESPHSVFSFLSKYQTSNNLQITYLLWILPTYYLHLGRLNNYPYVC